MSGKPAVDLAYKYTPGPWDVLPPDSTNPSQAIVCARIGVNIYSAPLTSETMANAHLIAAAPDLLEALKDALEAIRVFHGPAAWEIYNTQAPEMKRIHAAIAKAEVIR